MKKWMYWLLIFLMPAIFWYMDQPSSASKAPEPIETGVAVGQKMPEFTLNAVEGKQVTVKADGSKLIMINFFAAWCPPCKEEMPDLDVFRQKHQNDLTFYAVNLEEAEDEVLEFMAENGYTFKDALLFDADGKVAQTFRVNAIPTTVIADKNGIIKHVQIGMVTLAQLETLWEGLPKD